MNDARKTKDQLVLELAQLRRRVEVFEEIPLPATLIDPQGIIMNVNRAFLDHARSLGRNIRKEDRIGHSVYDFADTEEARAHLTALIQPLVSGERSHLNQVAIYTERRRHYENVHASAIRDADGQVAGVLLLREEVTEKVRQEERRQASLQLQEAIWKMAGSEDMEHLLIAVRDSLERLGVPFQNCGVNLVDPRTDPPSVRFHNMTSTGYWTYANPENPAAETVLRFWWEQQVVYRKDLGLEDLYGERSNIERDYGAATRSVVDVPFAQGTLAVNSIEPDVFSAEDIEILQEMVQVLSEGFRRLEDLQRLEQRNQELQREIAGRMQTEELLRQAEERYRQLFEEAPVMYVITRNQEGQPVISDCNRQFLTALGYSREEAVNRSLADFYTPASRAEVLEKEGYQRALEGHFIAEERQLVSRDGRMIETLLRAVPEFDAEGRVTGTRAMFLDITERKQSQDLLRQTNERLNLILNNLPLVAYELDTAGRWVISRGRGLEKLGRLPDEVGDKSIFEVYQDRPAILEAVRKAFTGQPQQIEVEVNGYLWLANYLPMVGVSGKVERVFGTALDITERKHAEGVLKESEERFRQLVENIDAVFWIIDPERTQNLYISPAHERIWGSARQSVYENLVHWQESIHPEDRERVVAGLERMASGNYDESYRIVRPDDGSVRWLRTRAFPIRDESGKVCRIAGITTDVTEARRQEEQRAVMLALQRVRNGILQMERQEDWEKVALACRRELDSLVRFAQCSIVLVDLQQSTGRAYYCPVPGEVKVSSYASIHPLLVRTVESGIPAYRRTRAQIDRGEERIPPRISSVIDIPFANGTLAVNSTEANAFSERDIRILEQFAQVMSEAHRRLQDLQALEAERQQKEESLKLSLALQQVRNKILQMQGEEDWQHIVNVVQEQLQPLVPFNACSVNLVDWVSEKSTVHYLQANGTRLTVLPGLPPAFKQAWETGRHVYRRNQAEMRQYEDRIELFEQQVHSVVDVPFTGGTLAINNLEEVAFATRDIDILEQFAQVLSEAHRRLQDLQALEEKEEQLRQVQKLEAIGQLAGGVAHDFNNLLTVVSGYSEVLERRIDPQGPGSEYLQEIQKATDRGAGLVRQLLAFSRKQVLQPTVLNLNMVIADLGKMLQRLIGEDIEFRLVSAPALGTVQADRGQIEQVLLNLVVNARDAMPQGGKLVIETANVEVDGSYALRRDVVEPGLYVRLSVSDTGVGMDKATQARIFEPFFTTKETGKGTGLGLATVYGIIKQSGGYIWVYSEPGQGTTFKIYLPRLEEADRPEADMEIARPSSRGAETLLLVEDEEAVRRLMALALREQGYTVLEARGGEEALQAGSRHAGPIHLLVTDVVMPGMNGRQLAERLAAAQGEMKVLFMSGYTEGIIEQHGILAPQVAFLQKPFSPDRLALKVREVLDSAR